MKRLLLLRFAILSSLVLLSLSAYAVVPGITSALWEDSDGDGSIDQLRIIFDTDIDIVDANAPPDGLDCIVFSVSPVTVTQTNNDYTSNVAGVSELILGITPIVGTDTLDYPTVSYLSGTTDHIYGNGTTDEVADGAFDVGDGAAPIIVGINAPPAADGTYAISDAVSGIFVAFSEDVTVVGAPTLTLETGTTDATITHTPGLPSDTLIFVDYVVASGHSSADLDANSLALGTSIQDADMNDADLSFTELNGNSENLSDTRAIVIDGIPPQVIDVTTAEGNGTYSNPTTLTIEVEFDNAVDVTGFPTIALNSGGTATYNGTGSGSVTIEFDYPIGASDAATDLDYSSTGALALSGGTIIDASNSNPADLTLPTPGAAGSIGANRNIVIEALAVPAVTTGIVKGIMNDEVTIEVNVTALGTPAADRAGVVYYPFDGTDKDLTDVPATALNEQNTIGGTGIEDINVTGLTPATRYSAVGYARENPNNNVGYGSRVDFYTYADEPSNDVADPTPSAITASGFTITWVAPGGNGADGYMVLQNTFANSAVLDTDFSTDVSDGTDVAGQTSIGSNSSEVTGLTETFSGLSAETRYYAGVIPFKHDGVPNAETYNYNEGNPGTVDVWTLSTAPAGHSSVFTATQIAGDEVQLDFDMASTLSADGYVLLRRTSAFTEPSDYNFLANGENPTANGPSAGTTLVTTITNNATTSYVNNSGISSGNTYYYALVPYNFNGSDDETYNYLNDNAAVPNATIGVGPFFTLSVTGEDDVVVDGVFAGTETLQFSVNTDPDEAAITVTADLSVLSGIYGLAESFSNDGGGNYSFQTFPAQFLTEGTIMVTVTADDAGNTFSQTIPVTINSEAPEMTVNRAYTPNADLTGVMLTGTTDDNSAQILITIDGTTYDSDAIGANFTVGGGSWTLNLDAVGVALPGAGNYDVNYTAIDDFGNSSSGILVDGVSVTNGVTVTQGGFTGAATANSLCVDEEFKASNIAIVITEDQALDFQQGNNQTIVIRLPSGFEYDEDATSGIIPMLSNTGASITGLAYQFTAARLMEVSFNATAASLSETNSITITNIPIKTISTTAVGPLNMTRQGGSAIIEGLPNGTVLGTLSNNVPAAPNGGTSLIGDLCVLTALNPTAIDPVNSANSVWYDGLANVYNTVLYSGADPSEADLGLSTNFPAVFNLYVTNSNGVCESVPTLVSLTVNENPTVEAGTIVGAVCSGEEIVLGGSGLTPTASGGAGSYSYRWTSDADPAGALAAFPGGGNLVGSDTVSSNPSISAPENANGFGNADAVITYSVIARDALNCESSDDVAVTVHPAINPTLAPVPDVGSYGEGFGDVELQVSPPATNPFSNGVISGTGVYYNTEDALPSNHFHAFDTEVALAGTHPITYTYTDANGCVESAPTINLVVEQSNSLIDNLPDAYGSSGITGTCLNEPVNPITVDASDALKTNVSGLGPGYEVSRLQYWDFGPYPSPGNNLPLLSGPGSNPGSNNNTYEYDVNDAFAIGGGFYGAQYVFIYADNYSSGEIWYSFQRSDIFPVPTVTIKEDKGNPSLDDLTQFYCESDGNLVLGAELEGEFGTVNEATGGSITIELASNPATQTATTNTIDLADPLGTGSFTPGEYIIRFTSDSADDPAPYGGNGCVDTVVESIFIRESPPAAPINTTGSTAVVQFDAADETNIDYDFEYCQGDAIANISVPIAANEGVTWFEDLDRDGDFTTGTINNLASTPTIVEGQLFANHGGTLSGDYYFGFRKTTFINNPAGFAGCEGGLTIIRVTVHAPPVGPDMDVSASAAFRETINQSYIYDYCVGDTPVPVSVQGGSVTDDVDFYEWYAGTLTSLIAIDDDTGAPDMTDEAGVGTITALGNSSATMFELLGLPPSATVPATAIGDTTFYVRYVTNRNPTTNASGGFFAGCSSNLVEININVNADPDPVSVAQPAFTTQYFTCEGDGINDIVLESVTGISYKWYVGDADTDINDFGDAVELEDAGGDPIITRTLSQAIISSGNGGFNLNTPGLYEYWVSRIGGLNEVSGFTGCESAPTRVSIIVYGDEAAPDILPTSSNIDHGPYNTTLPLVPNINTFNYCETDLVSNITNFLALEENGYVASSPDGALVSRQFNWYLGRLNGTDDSIIFLNPVPLFTSATEPAGDTQQDTVSLADLFLIGAQDNTAGDFDTRYFIVEQLTDIRDDALFEGCPSPYSFIAVNIYDIPDAVTNDIGDDDDPLNDYNDYYYCNTDPLLDITVDGEAGNLYTWYDEDFNVITSGIDLTTITEAELLTTFGVDNDTITTSGVEAVFTFFVSQTSNVGEGLASFAGCESALTEISITMLPNPPPPVLEFAAYEVCEGDLNPTFRILNQFGTAEVRWYRAGESIELFTGSTYTPVESLDGEYNFEVEQVTGLDIDGRGFPGCLSGRTPFTFTIYPTASTPQSTAPNNTYVYCLGEPIENIEILNPESGVTYTWYNDAGLENQLQAQNASGSVFDPEDNGLFDPFEPGTTSFFVSATENLSCASSATNVRIVINDLPDVFVFPPGQADIFDGEVIPLCVDNGPYDLFGSFAGDSAGVFTGDGITNFDGDAVFDPLAALNITDPLAFAEGSQETIPVKFTLQNSNGCVDSLNFSFLLSALPTPDFRATVVTSDGLRQQQAINFGSLEGAACIDIDPNTPTNSTSLTLESAGAYPVGEFVINQNDTLIVTRNTFENISLDEFLVDTLTQVDIEIEFFYSDENSCSQSIFKTLTIHRNPLVRFDFEPGCVGEPISLSAEPLAPFTGADIASYRWAVNGQEQFSSIDPNFTTTIVNNEGEPTTGQFTVSVLAQSANIGQCVSVFDLVADDRVGNTQLIPIGDFPEVDFSWARITEGRATTFTSSEAAVLPFNTLAEGSIDWGDGSTQALAINEEIDTVAFASLDHTYADDGWYDARVTLITENGCDTFATKTVKILPFENLTSDLGYINDFSASTEEGAGWFIDVTQSGSIDRTSTAWVYGGLQKPGFDGDQGFGTGLEQDYAEDDSSWIYSPAFDLSDFSRPMVVFDGLFDFPQQDGTVLQYSTDNGDSWQILGRYIDGDDQGTGLYWYNTEDIDADPGGQGRASNGLNNSFGWGGEGIRVTTKTSIRHKLDEIPRKGFVRFRFVFASAGGASSYGFAVDNFQIVERDRVALIEQFSNSNARNAALVSKMANEEINARLDSALLNNGDIVAVNYYTDIYGNDPLFEVNEAGPSARTLFYGVNRITSLLDGNTAVAANASLNEQVPPWSGADANRKVLSDAKVALDFTLENSDSDEISISASVTPRVDLSNQEVRIYFAVVEKVITGTTLPNGETDVRNVFRQFLPSALGHIVEDGAIGAVNSFEENWTIDSRKVIDPDNLAVVGFVQNASGNKEIYQAARVDINGKSSVLGVGDLIEIDDLNIYPNPAHEAFNVTFDRTLEEDFSWVVYDQTGRTMLSGEVNRGQDGFRIQTLQLPSGIYLFSIGNDVKQYAHQRIIVKH